MPHKSIQFYYSVFSFTFAWISDIKPACLATTGEKPMLSVDTD